MHFSQPLPDKVCKQIVECFLRDLVAPHFTKHFCHRKSPCVQLKKIVQLYLPLFLVCKKWKIYVARELENGRLYRPVYPGPKSYKNILNHRVEDIVLGPYHITRCLERDFEKHVCVAKDYGGPEGCLNIRQEVVIKFSDNEEKAWENETKFHQWFSEDKTFTDTPQFIWSGHADGCYLVNAIIMERMGKDLNALREIKLFTPKLALAVAIQTLQIYQRLHEKGWLHLNAKPGNFVIGPNVPWKNSRIFVIDFEASRPVTLQFQDRSTKDGWNVIYRPLTWNMEGVAPSARDDLEGLGYVFAHLQREKLPWSNPLPETMTRLTELKASITTQDLFRGMPPVFVKYFNGVKALAWNETPRYEEIIGDFKQAWKDGGYTGSPFDVNWWEEFDLKEEPDDDSGYECYPE